MKKLLTILGVFLLLAVATVRATSPLLVDNADLLTADEEATLLSSLEDIARELDIDAVIVTVDSLEGKTARAYADDYYDYHGYSPNGVLLLISMAEREWYISTSGTAMSAVTNSEVEHLGDAMVNYLSSGAYLTAFLNFTSNLRKAAADQGQTASETYKDPMVLLACFGGAAVIGLVVVLIMKGQLKSVRSQSTASGYVVPGSFGLTSGNELFLYQNMTRTPRPQNNGGGTHYGSTGRRHGGGGGRF